MPKILTDAYRDATFFVTYNEDKTEGVYLKPLTDTMKGKLRNEAQKEAGADDAQTGAIGRQDITILPLDRILDELEVE